MNTKEIITLLDPSTKQEKLKRLLVSPSFNDELLVKVASANLVVPTLYITLKQKNLLKHIPSELSELTAYLNEITTLNTDRNQKLIEEVYFLSRLFNQHHIAHVFVKGAALLVSGYLPDIGYRMVGDIDVLIAPHQIQIAKAVLEKEGYYQFHSDMPFEFLNEHQMARLISKTKMAAVELHVRLLFKGEDAFFNAKDYLEKKQIVNGVYIGAPRYLFLHALLNMQCNDFAFYFNTINLKAIADYLVLRQLYVCNEKDLSHKLIQNFIWKYKCVLNPKTPTKGLKMIFFKLNLKYSLVGKISYHILKRLKKLWFMGRTAFKLITSPSMQKAYLKHKTNSKDKIN